MSEDARRSVKMSGSFGPCGQFHGQRRVVDGEHAEVELLGGPAIDFTIPMGEATRRPPRPYEVITRGVRERRGRPGPARPVWGQGLSSVRTRMISTARHLI